MMLSKNRHRQGVLVLKPGTTWEGLFKNFLKEIKGRPFTELEALAFLYCYGLDFKKADADGVGANVSGIVE
jgi:hypothetical protein